MIFQRANDKGRDKTMNKHGWIVQPARLVQLLMPLVLVFVLPVVSAAVEVGEKAPAEGTGTITGVVNLAGTHLR